MESMPREGATAQVDERSVEQELEEARVGHAIPTVAPLRNDELPSDPPPKVSYRRRVPESLRELWRYRETIYTLAERDIRVRYKQAVLGAAWAILNPLVLMVLFSVVFGRIAKIQPPGGVPYPVFSYVALVPWAFFAGAVGYGSTSVLANGPIIRKVYCPREAFPIAAVIGSGFDFLTSSVIVLGMLLFNGYLPTLTWIAVPLLLLTLLVLATALTMLTAVITAFYRDTRYGVPLILQILLYVTPVAYPLQRVIEGDIPGIAKTLYVYLNPLTPIMDGFRRTILYEQWPEMWPFLTAVGITLALTAVSYRLFKRLELVISDVV
jgi:ABC-type polysaccharide/polyol phosphate export permease